MKYLFFLIGILSTFSACKFSRIDTESIFWGRLEEDQNYLFRENYLTSIVDGELNAGSLILFGAVEGDFQTVYIKKKNKSKRSKYYLHKPKYLRLGSYSSDYTQNLNEVSASITHDYNVGPRGGCFYVNSNGNVIYVDKSFCKSHSSSTPSRLRSAGTSSSSGSTYVKGHYRTSKSGKRTYVKPHTRKKY